MTYARRHGDLLDVPLSREVARWSRHRSCYWRWSKGGKRPARAVRSRHWLSGHRGWNVPLWGAGIHGATAGHLPFGVEGRADVDARVEGIVHRDLKPENVILTRPRRAARAPGRRPRRAYAWVRALKEKTS